MQSNDSSSRLVKAARRTIRAEVTLVVVIVIITSWSVYALYRLTVGGSESLFGLSFSKSNGQSSEDETKGNKAKQILPDRLATEQLIYSLQQPNEQQARIRRRLVEELKASQQELYKNLITRRKLRPPQEQNRAADADSSRLNFLKRVSSVSHNEPGNNYDHLASNISPTRTDNLITTAPLQATADNPDADYSANVDLVDDSATTKERQPAESNEDYAEPESGKNNIDIAVETSPGAEESIAEQEPANDDDQQQQSESEGGENSQDQDGNSEELDKPDEESLKEAGHMIDDEVDRMTQPSSDVVYQHRKQPNSDYQNTIQFDDSPVSGGGQSGTNKQVLTAKAGLPGDLVVRFALPQTEQPGDKKAADGKVKAATDLQVDHGTPVASRHSLGSDVEADLPRGTGRAVKKQKKKESKTARLVAEPALNKSIPTNSSQSTNENERKKIKRRMKRAVQNAIKIKTPNEIEPYFKQLDFDSLLSESSEAAKSMVQVELPSKDTSRKLLVRKNNSSVNRRNDDQDDGDEGQDNGEEHQADEGQEEQEDDRLSSDTANLPLQLPNYHQLTSNDRDLQELIARQKLIDDLRMSQLPSPIASNSPNKPLINQQTETDPQSADTLFTVDHGLLLSPADESHYKHKSMSKKKKKHEKKKHKKKMTIAMKKGGHKKKKHKKEEKKFMKEKKFKGAKKGKKVAKGKGGQGGKKGKKLYKDKGFKKKGFKNVYHKEEFGQKKSYFDEFRDKDFKKKWKKYDDKYNYAQMKKWQAKDVKGAKKVKDHGEKYKKYDKSKWKKKYEKHSAESKASSKKHKKSDGFK